jgi:hypothetical protein
MQNRLPQHTQFRSSRKHQSKARSSTAHDDDLLQGRARYHPQTSESLALLLAPNRRNPTASRKTLLKGHLRSVLQLLSPRKSTSTCSAACAKCTTKSSRCSKQGMKRKARFAQEDIDIIQTVSWMHYGAAHHKCLAWLYQALLYTPDCSRQKHESQHATNQIEVATCYYFYSPYCCQG